MVYVTTMPPAGATLSLSSVTLNWPLLLGSPAVASLAVIETVVASSSAIATVAVTPVAATVAPA